MKRGFTISVCLTVFNEEKTIESLLQSLFNQTKRPSEIVICDGGSGDGTVGIIRNLQKTHKNILLFISPGNVAHGRNVAIKNAKGEIIACIDAGCSAKKDWLTLLHQGFGRQAVDLVAGFYEMKWTNSFQKIMALYRGTHPKRYGPKTFIPSCRSVAFKKSVWKELGGFDESLSLSGEDTDFFYRAMKKGHSIKRMKNAVVYWNEPMYFTFRDFKKFFYYAKGDAQTGIWWDPVKGLMTHNIKLLTICIRYALFIGFIIASLFNPFFFLLFVISLLSYVFWSIWKWRDVVTKWNERLWIPIVQIGTDIMVMAGFLNGLIVQK